MNLVFFNVLFYSWPHRALLFATSARTVCVAFNQYRRPIYYPPVGHRRYLNIMSIMAGSVTPSKAEPRRSARLANREGASIGEEGASIECDRFRSMKVTELKDLLRQNGLSPSGNKKVLIDRLLSAEAASQKREDTSSHSDSKSIGTKRRKLNRKVTPESSDSTTDCENQVSVQSNGAKCLPRTREMQLRSSDKNLMVIGVDEAGRGPLAGPVVAAAAIVPSNIAGVIDSKRITKEEERDRLYEDIIASPGIRYAVAIISAKRIDEINILQATLEGMRMATKAVIEIDQKDGECASEENNVASAERTEISYVITGYTNHLNDATKTVQDGDNKYHALVDGNKVPNEMPCPAESLVKGDGREFAIASASILAKVTRDRLMHEYDKKFPEYELSKHKGYPTAAHMAIVKRIGASAIHRRTFAPLKHMKFDDDGKIIG